MCIFDEIFYELYEEKRYEEFKELIETEYKWSNRSIYTLRGENKNGSIL